MLQALLVLQAKIRLVITSSHSYHYHFSAIAQQQVFLTGGFTEFLCHGNLTVILLFSLLDIQL